MIASIVAPSLHAGAGHDVGRLERATALEHEWLACVRGSTKQGARIARSRREAIGT